jgi:hypothetical protein
MRAGSCQAKSIPGQAAAGLGAVGPCVELRGLETYGDASPDLMYCAEAERQADAGDQAGYGDPPAAR